MSVITAREGDVHVLRLDRGEHRFHPELLDALEAALDEIEGAPGPAAVVLTGTGKFFSNGLDLEWMGGAPEGGAQAILDRVHRLYGRLLAWEVPTVGALNGHAFAGGAMLSLALDQRVMRADRGWWCLPEVTIGLPFTPGMSALCAAKLRRQTAHVAMTSARRYPGPEALEAGIVDALAGEAELLPDAVARAAALAPTRGPVLAAIKRELHAVAISRLRAGAQLPA